MKITTFVIFGALLLVSIITPLTAQQKTLNRLYDPVIIKGKQFGISDIKIAEWSAYRFNASTGQWLLIPFQIDEVDNAGNFVRENDGVVDDNDELVFMPGDAGDQATTRQWLNDPVAGSLARIELELVDPIKSGEKAWIYLYNNVANKGDIPGYFHYIPAPDNSGADTIITPSYKIAHNRKGWTDFVSLAANYNKDLIDRIKFHIRSDPFLFGQALPTIILTEDTLNFSTEQFYLNPVRSFQKIKAIINLEIEEFPFPIPSIDDTFIMPYFPYSNVIGAGFTVDDETRSILLFLAINKIRLSMDFDPAIAGMKFFSAANQNGIVIDGKPDAPNTTIPDATGLNWVMASGTDGTILEFFKFPNMPNSIQKIYYYDDVNATNASLPDSTIVSGDGKSYGDMGLWLTGDALIPRSDSLFISFTAFFINEQNKTAAFASDLLDAIKNPVTIKALIQSRTSAISDEENRSPDRFTLFDAYPNPFYPGMGNITFRFQPGQNMDQAGLGIYNIAGQEVTRLHPGNFLNHDNAVAFRWDGRTADGWLLPAGIYFCHFKSNGINIAKKILLLH